jgi:uncharacterized DUF497 family protein
MRLDEDVEHSEIEPRRCGWPKQLAQPPTHEYMVPRRKDEEVTRIISAQRGSRKERPMYEVKEVFGYS